MKVSFLFESLSGLPGVALRGVSDEAEASSVRFDSRKLERGCVFVAVRGTSRNGHDFLAAAMAAGAAGLVVEDPSAVPSSYAGAVAAVPDARVALGLLAARFYGDPSRSLFAVALTGTNGKTTSTHLVEAILGARGWPTGVIGTIDHHLGSRVWPADLTTPDAVEFQRRLQDFVAHGAKAVALEASSHALDQRRVDGVALDCAIFTNLTRDHLDYHSDMESYFRAKARLFDDLLARSPKPRRRAILNADDAHGARLATELRAQAPSFEGDFAVWTFGSVDGADFRWKVSSMGYEGSSFRLTAPIGERDFRVRMPGLHNVANAVGAIAAGVAAGASLDQCAAGLESVVGVSGRLERVENKQDLHVFVDFAHTASALEGALAFLNQLRPADEPRARIVTVFGCGGDRDKGKRPLMMQAALAGSDFVVLTSDNPRTEDPVAIMREALAGAPEGVVADAGARTAIQNAPIASGALDLVWSSASASVRAVVACRPRVLAEPDRGLAIQAALALVRPGDVVLIAGKGHEAYQQIGAVKRPFSDQDIVRGLLGRSRP